MRKRSFPQWLGAMVLLVASSTVQGEDWPQWRGPKRDGHSAEKAILDKWPEDGPKLVWSLTELDAIGTGYGSPAVVGNRMYIIGADGNKQTAKEFVTCLDLTTGKQIWRESLAGTTGKYSDGWGGGPRSTPTIDGKFAYVLGSTGDFACLDTETGKIAWQKNLVSDFGGAIPTWGYSESPLVDGDQVVVTPGSKGGVLALNKKTGETVWQCKDVTDGAGYSSLMITEVAGVRQYVQQTMASGIGVRASDGKLLWKVGGIGRRVAVIPTPVLQDNYVFFTAGYGAGCECFKLEADGEGTKAVEVYSKNKVVSNHHGGVVRLGDHIYGHSDRLGWVCFPLKTGGEEAVWENKGVGKGSVTFANGNLYCYGESSGTIALVKANPEKYEEISKFTIPQTSKLRMPQGKVWAHPVIANGKLILRDYELLFVYDIKAK
ncbi:MAG: PQQ-binding-like beta-propeller repeat protein [Zavarzinella sp.]